MLRIYNFNDKSGTVTIEQNGREFILDLYGEGKCNCFCATVFKAENEYQLQWFFMDEDHGKRMLGLQKAPNGEKINYLAEVTKLTIYKSKCSNWQKIMMMFAKAFDNLTIEIKEEETSNES